MGLGLLSLMRPGANRPRPVEREIRMIPPTPELRVERPTEPPPVRSLRPRDHPRSVEPEPDVAPADPDEPVEVGVIVRDAEGREIQAMIEPIDCPDIEFTTRMSFRAPPGPCVVRAVRMDGLLAARGQPVTLMVRSEGQAFDVPMDEPPKGGIGVQFRGTEQGMRVQQVLPGTPAARAGMEAGDLIVGVEGESVVGMPIEDFVEQITGPEGSDVAFTVEYTTDTGTTQQQLLVTRERLGS